MKKKVYVLDYDLISPLGIGRESVLKSLESNYLAAKKISRFPTIGLQIEFAAEISDPLFDLYLKEDEMIIDVAKYDRKFELAIAIYYIMESRLQEIASKTSQGKSGIVLGLGIDVPPLEAIRELIGEKLTISENSFIDFFNKINKTKGYINKFLNPLDLSALFIAKKLNLSAFQKTIMTACVSSTQAIGIAYDSILADETEVAIAGGTDSLINTLAFIAFNKLGVLSTGKSGHEKACKPFDITRNGALAGEASGLCVLASEEFVKKNNLTPKLEILGYGNTLDAYNITSPDPSGLGMSRAFEMALKNSGITPSDVDYINLHGTGTRSNDEVEFKAIKKVFGEYAKSIPMSSTKDRHGHAIASAGIQEFCILCLCMENDFIPCNINLEKPIGNGELDLVQNENRRKKVNIGLTSNFAFGGVNTVIALKKI